MSCGGQTPNLLHPSKKATAQVVAFLRFWHALMRLNLYSRTVTMSKFRHPSPPIAGVEPHTLRVDQIDLGPPALFSPGHVVATPAALALIQEHGASVSELLHRHLTGDWLEMCKADRDANWAAVLEGETRVFSSFNIAAKGHANTPVNIWIFTERDRSVSTILRPGDY